MVTSATDRQSDIHYADNITPASITPTFDNGYLAVYDRGPNLLVYGRDGSLAVTFSPPEHSFVSNAAVDVDGSVAVAIVDSQKQGGRITILDPRGKELRLIEMEYYIPAGVCFAPDHSIWIIGGPTELDGLENYEILRHYSAEGEELGRYLPRSSFPAGQPVQVVIGHWMLRITAGRIGAFLNHGGRGQAFWVETDMMGKETGRWPVDPDYHLAAFGDRGVYAETTHGLVKLDRQSSQWRTASSPGEGHVLGAYRGDLVFMPRGENSITFATPAP